MAGPAVPARKLPLVGVLVAGAAFQGIEEENPLGMALLARHSSVSTLQGETGPGMIHGLFSRLPSGRRMAFRALPPAELPAVGILVATGAVLELQRSISAVAVTLGTPQGDVTARQSVSCFVVLECRWLKTLLGVAALTAAPRELTAVRVLVTARAFQLGKTELAASMALLAVHTAVCIPKRKPGFGMLHPFLGLFPSLGLQMAPGAALFGELTLVGISMARSAIGEVKPPEDALLMAFLALDLPMESRQGVPGFGMVKINLFEGFGRVALVARAPPKLAFVDIFVATATLFWGPQKCSFPFVTLLAT